MPTSPPQTSDARGGGDCLSPSPVQRWTGEASLICEFASALDDTVATVRSNIAAFGPHYPDDTTVGGRYLPRPAAPGFAPGANRGWTTGFWPGMQWLAYEVTGAPGFRAAGEEHVADFERRVELGEDIDTHDLGFLYTLACVAPWRLTGSAGAWRAGIAAADALMTRFSEPAGVVQAWGDLTDPAQRGRTIIDSLLNMPLLTWAAEQTGQERYAAAVARHCARLAERIVRPDDSTFHTFTWDPATGAPVGGSTAQGAHDDSCWARGQAWGVLGFALNAQATGDARLLRAAERCADYLLAHLPADGVPYWDLVFTSGDEPRDSSAAAIAVCGLHELAPLVNAERSERYSSAARDILRSLVKGYTPGADGVRSDALLLHSVYSAPGGVGVDEGSLWGDYFYLEALVRHCVTGWRRYW
ncbi:glycoside hydrolase family 88 protein [Xylanimonas ulmi]|uniref:Unsaturated chondroitin disaccharide hydrolase n=1 Tax=Xylanimonas ulmi TaxID=228973 RepID=A0A4Q7M236_9MICO|nr:glycoside hydrolase family 88 protein [Xylanibacterium ulmi]RZS61926.1 unsaturated chondroitin disaccharide hydrolase [Xylanibacterium ulmi]